MDFKPVEELKRAMAAIEKAIPIIENHGIDHEGKNLILEIKIITKELTVKTDQMEDR